MVDFCSLRLASTYSGAIFLTKVYVNSVEVTFSSETIAFLFQRPEHV